MKKLLLKLLGVDKLVRDAFEEGWKMRGDNYYEYESGEVYSVKCWKSSDDAWANSDTEELL